LIDGNYHSTGAGSVSCWCESNLSVGTGRNREQHREAPRPSHLGSLIMSKSAALALVHRRRMFGSSNRPKNENKRREKKENKIPQCTAFPIREEKGLVRIISDCSACMAPTS
jgi:hypothetical protein